MFIKGDKLKTNELRKDEPPIEFEDDWGRKLDKSFSISLDFSSYVEIGKNWGKKSVQTIEIEFWFKSIT